jgi:NAD(P)-dependent dehydrogenase (short-subunit alcohol dehydrogenase family)
VSKRVVITGAASGIGEATAADLRRRGCQVVGLDLRSGGDLVACDVRDQSSVDSAVAEAVARLGGLDVLINCAGVGDPQSASERPGEDALRVINVNLLGTWRVTAAAIDALRESHGRVINIASGLAHLTIPLATAYTLSKRGVVAYSDSLRLEMAGEVGVTTVYPGYIRTPIHEASAEKGLRLEGIAPGSSRLRDVEEHPPPNAGPPDAAPAASNSGARPLRRIGPRSTTPKAAASREKRRNLSH